MTDIAVGRALWNDLARQVAVRTRDFDAAQDLPPTAYLKLDHYRAQAPTDEVAAFPVRTPIKRKIEAAFRARLNADPGNAVAFEAANANWESVSALPANYALMRFVCSRLESEKGVFQIIEMN